MKKSLILSLLVISNMVYSQNAWRKIGNIAPEAGGNNYIYLAIDSNNVPYVAYGDNNNGTSSTYLGTTVKKFNGTAWELVGQRAFSGSDYVGGTKIVIDRQNIPYLAYSMGVNGSYFSQFKVDKFNGTGWDNLILFTGTGSTPIDRFNSIVFDRNNVPCFAYVQYPFQSDIKFGSYGSAMAFNSTVIPGNYPDLAFDGNNTPYLAYRENGPLHRACVQRFNGTSWEPVGPPGVSAGITQDTRIAIDNNNVPYITYVDLVTATPIIYVHKFNGTTWEIVGSTPFAGFKPMLTFDRNNVLHLAFSDFLTGVFNHPNYLGMTVQKFNGTSWSLVGQRTFSPTNSITHGCQLVFGKNNVAYIGVETRYDPFIGWKADAYYFGPPTFPMFTLPVKLLSFEATAAEGAVVVKWSTASEINNDFFTIERSKDGVSFSEVATINAAGNSSSALNYTHTDSRPFEGRSFYRLKQTDIDGHHTYSDVRAVHILKDGVVQIFPVNAAGSFTVAVAKPTRSMQIEVYDVAGVLVHKTSSINQVNTISLNKQAKGLYVVRVMEGRDVIGVKRVVR